MYSPFGVAPHVGSKPGSVNSICTSRALNRRLAVLERSTFRDQQLPAPTGIGRAVTNSSVTGSVPSFEYRVVFQCSIFFSSQSYIPRALGLRLKPRPQCYPVFDNHIKIILSHHLISLKMEPGTRKIISHVSDILAFRLNLDPNPYMSGRCTDSDRAYRKRRRSWRT